MHFMMPSFSPVGTEELCHQADHFYLVRRAIYQSLRLWFSVKIWRYGPRPQDKEQSREPLLLSMPLTLSGGSIFLSMLSIRIVREKLRDQNQFFPVEQECNDENHNKALRNIRRELIPKDHEIRKRPRRVV